MLTSEVRPAEARFELTLAFHCAPALAGIKPADLIALPGEGDETDALHGGQGYKYSGLWKVYSDVERAQRCFRQYGCCRRALCRRLEAGCRLVQLFRTA